jgi:hypothetical protein
MRRKPADDLVSYGLFGSHEAAPAKRNDVGAELVVAPVSVIDERFRGHSAASSHFDPTLWISIWIKRVPGKADIPDGPECRLMTRLYGPAVCRKPDVERWRGLVLRFCIRPVNRAFMLAASGLNPTFAK